MKRIAVLPAAFFAVSVCAAAAVPVVGNVKVTQHSTSSVKVTYDLAGCNGIVTVDFLTNGVTVGQSNIAGLKGDVCKLVEVGPGRCFTWKPASGWPESQSVGSARLTARVTAWAENTPPDYLVVDLDNPLEHRYYEVAAAVPGGVGDKVYKTSKIVFRRIHAANATYPMGSPADEIGRCDQKHAIADELFIGNESAHLVSFTNDFYLGIYELTKEQFRRIMDEASLAGNSPDGEDAMMLPQDTLSKGLLHGKFQYPATGADRWGATDASVLGMFRKKTGFQKCTLPTEAEWEYACRAGEYSAFYWGGQISVDEDGTYVNGEIGDYAWHAGNSGGTTHPVGLKEPNAWGLYDMLGNVGELTLDLARSWIYFKTPPYPTVEHDETSSLQTLDPLMDFGTAGWNDWQQSGPVRGGSYWEEIDQCRSASRSFPKQTWAGYATNSGAHIGCRLAIRLD